MLFWKGGEDGGEGGRETFTADRELLHLVSIIKLGVSCQLCPLPLLLTGKRAWQRGGGFGLC